MNYEIHIKDRLNYSEPLILHYAARSTPRLSHLGGDSKTQGIIPSELKFTLENAGAEDGKYLEYFTSNETRYEVTQLVSDTQQLIWKGYLLPETYAEPWDGGVLYPEFAATDGLGLLRGKMLPDSIYKNEVTVIEILTACLKLTEIELDIYFAPAILNHLKQAWHEIITDGLFLENENAYYVLEKLIFSLRCRLYQAQGRWYIEGFNQLHLINVKYWHYNINGDYLGQVTLTRNIKKLTWLDLNLTMVPAIKEVRASHPSPDVNFNEEIVNEKKINWLAPTGTNGDFIARHWIFPQHYIPYISPPDNNLRLYASRSATLLEANKIELRQKPWIKKGAKLRFKMAAQLGGAKMQYTLPEEERTDTLVYRLSIDGKQYYYNLITGQGSPARLFFNEGGAATLEINFIAADTGFLNLELWEPRYNLSGLVTPARVDITELSLEEIAVEDTAEVTVAVDPDSSRVVDLDLTFSQDTNVKSPAFYLEKIRALDTQATPANVEIPILYTRIQEGKNYAIVNVTGAVLIDQFPGQVFDKFFNPLDGLAVHFNFNGGEEMAVETPDLLADFFLVKVYPYKDPVINRGEWEKWTDSRLVVEQKNYLQVAAEIESRLFETPHLKGDGVTDNPVKINDLVEFTYLNEKKYFFLTNAEWVPDENETAITMVEGVYSGLGIGNLPPYVEAGPNIYLNPGETQAQILEAVVYDPDGEVTGLQWEKESGDPGGSFSNNTALLPLITGLTGNAYTFKLTATDNSGAQGFDTMQVLRYEDFALEKLETYGFFGVNQYHKRHDRTYKLFLDPGIPEGEQLILNFNAWVALVTPTNWTHGALFKIIKNGVQVFFIYLDTISNPGTYNSSSGTLSYTAGDTIELVHEVYFVNANNSTPEGLRGEAGIKWLGGSFQVNPQRRLTGVPTSHTVSSFT